MEYVGPKVEGASSSGSISTPLLISMAGIVGTTLAIVAYHFIVVRFCLRSRQRLMQMQLQASLSQQQPSSQSNGVDEKVLNSIPILSYSTKICELFHVDQSECVICLGELEDGDLVRLLPNCRHVFHNPCIDNWFLGHTNCPVCRSPIAVPITIASEASLPVENDYHRDHDQVREREVEAGVNYSAHLHDPEQGALSTTTTATTSIQLPKPNVLLRHCVSLAVLPTEGNNKQQSFVTGLERSLSLDQSHVHIDIQREIDHKPSSSSSSSISSSSCSASTKPVLTQCGSFTARSMRQLDRMSSVLVRSLSQLRMAQSSSTTNGEGILPS